MCVAKGGMGGYERLFDDQKADKLRKAFDLLPQRRAEWVMKVVKLLADGYQLSVSKVLGGKKAIK